MDGTPVGLVVLVQGDQAAQVAEHLLHGLVVPPRGPPVAVAGRSPSAFLASA
jgi:hypothetical protein